jgi:glycosyltransferase involved in cell wall biosynthesis
MKLSVIIPTHNPNEQRLQRTLDGLCAQTFPAAQWELLVVDNASLPIVRLPAQGVRSDLSVRIVQEFRLGLSSARKTGLRESRGEIIVFVDDDNVLAPDYLEQVCAAFARLPRVGALGGKSLPEFAAPVATDDWRREFFPLLALRDLGDNELVSQGLRPPGSSVHIYPAFAPIGAGMALRIEALQTWLTTKSNTSDRRGDELTSAGDNDMVLSIMKAGWEVGYLPALTLTHLIPAHRVATDYLARLNFGIQKSWTQVLLAHDASPWPPIPGWSVPLRKLKAWFAHRAWRSPAARIRWLGACGHFEGRAY